MVGAVVGERRTLTPETKAGQVRVRARCLGYESCVEFASKEMVASNEMVGMQVTKVEYPTRYDQHNFYVTFVGWVPDVDAVFAHAAKRAKPPHRHEELLSVERTDGR
eukprot:CAMPEP_0171090326 /NCGR_PEP_ID=MMETSP0766_2-20121228/30310_1 /TAXON_ID=439317 /ORGANISM="Gambierdiscus australes, Strain CAWD 149" /LENGTH=106 /DNA_ID=CAMNT_0011548303 /DNA_START=127 /DNA_END=447 /DNA_ORIENTATION=-